MDFLQGNIKSLYRKLLKAAVGSALIQSVFAMADAMMVGKYHGPSGVASLAVFSPIWNIMYSLGILVAVGGSVWFANKRGAGREEEARQYFTLTLLFGAVLSAVTMAVIGIWEEPLLYFFGADEELLVLAQDYLRSIWYAIPCSVFATILTAFLQNDGAAGLAMKAVIAAGVFNFVGDYFCVFVMDMGIRGAGLATAIGMYLSVVVMLFHFVGKKNTLRLARVKEPLKKMARITTTGFASAITDLAMGMVAILLNRQIMTYLGADALAVYGIITQIVPFVQCCAYGTGQAAQPILSQNYGAGQYERTSECLKYALRTSAFFGIAWLAAIELVPNLFVHLFMTPTDSVLAVAPGILRAYGLSLLFCPVNVFATYYFQSVMKPKVSMVISLARGVVLSSAMILLLPVIAGANAIWYAMLITEVVVLAYSMLQMKRCTETFAKGSAAA